MSVSIIIPLYNESAMLEQALRPFLSRLDQAGLNGEVWLCENGSTDGTLEVARRLAAEFPRVRAVHLGHANYGAALRDGISRATGEHIACMNLDLLEGPFLTRALDAIRDADVVTGSKTLDGQADRRPFLRRMITRTFNRLLWLLFGTRLTDTHGNKLLRRRTVQPVASRCRTDRWLFDTELLLRCERAGLRVRELPFAIEEVRKARYALWRQVPSTLANLAVLFWTLRIRDRQP